MLIKDARPKILFNKIYDNDGIGIFIRDRSVGKIRGNEVNSGF